MEQKFEDHNKRSIILIILIVMSILEKSQNLQNFTIQRCNW